MKNSGIIILATILIAINFSSVNAQEDLEKKPVTRSNKFQVGVNFSLDNSNRILKNGNGDEVNDILINLYNENDKFKIGYTAGLNFCYNFNRTIAIETGIYYSNKGYQSIIELNYINQPDPISLKKMRSVYNYNYVDVPLKANFTFGKKKLRFTTSTGLVLNRFLTSKTVIYREFADSKENFKTKETSEKLFNPITISATVSAGIDWKLSSKTNLKIEPTFRYGLKGINNDPIVMYLWNYGINVNYSFGF